VTAGARRPVAVCAPARSRIAFWLCFWSFVANASATPGNAFAQGEMPDSAATKADVTAPVAADFKSCIDRIAPDALHRVSRKTFDDATAGLQPDPDVLEQLQSQPEFTQAIWDYLDGIGNENRIADGRSALQRFQPVFDAVEEAFGIDRFIIAAIWGVETNYGTATGSHSVIRATATLACMGRRQAYFRDEFLAALEILERGDIAAGKFNGSWSGAFGGTQFMPTTFLRFALDFNGNGRRDIVDDVPDILASTANLLRAYGWGRDKPCAFEVTLSPGFDFFMASGRKPNSEWIQSGASRVGTGRAMDQRDSTALSLPAGSRGPAFLISTNFDVILRYNPAEAYAFAVCQLADRLRGEDPVATPWPRDERTLSSDERTELQSLLGARGFDAGPIDGIMGTRTRSAVREFQIKSNLVPDGFPSASLLERLR
jgi:membrane-bound lytic murein transglycosylase B